MRYWLLAENVDEIDRTLPYCLNAERVIALLIGHNSSKIAKLSVSFGNKSNKFNYAFSFPIEECDMDRLYEIEQAAHPCALVNWEH